MFEIVMGIDDFLIQLVKYCICFIEKQNEEIEALKAENQNLDLTFKDREKTITIDATDVSCQSSKMERF